LIQERSGVFELKIPFQVHLELTAVDKPQHQTVVDLMGQPEERLKVPVGGILNVHLGAYDGPVVFAQDYMVFNITKEDIRVRMSAVDEDIFPEPAIRPKQPPPMAGLPFSPFTLSGAAPFPEVMGAIWNEINQAYGTDLQPPLA
jgi:hypothetical protein